MSFKCLVQSSVVIKHRSAMAIGQGQLSIDITYCLFNTDAISVATNCWRKLVVTAKEF